MINGGVGLPFSGNATREEQIAYGVIAVIIWLSMNVIVIGIRLNQGKQIPGSINRKRRRSYESARTAVNDSPESRPGKGSQEIPGRTGLPVNFRHLSPFGIMVYSVSAGNDDAWSTQIK